MSASVSVSPYGFVYMFKMVLTNLIPIHWFPYITLNITYDLKSLLEVKFEAMAKLLLVFSWHSQTG